MNGNIFRVTLAAQARYLAPVLALAVVLATLLPLLTVQGVQEQTHWWGGRVELLLEQSRMFAAYYPALALCFGIFFAAANWLPAGSIGIRDSARFIPYRALRAGLLPQTNFRAEP